MLTLVIIAVVVLLAVALIRRLAQEGGRQAREDEQQKLEDLLGGGEGSGLGFTMRAGTRSYRLDPKTGEWVEDTEKPAAEPPRHKPRTRSKGLSSPNTLLGMFDDGSGAFEVERAEDLTNFADVGGMETLKQEVRDTVGLVLQHPDGAERYGIDWNGILLHGPPGVGKTFFARAIAGEYGLNLIHVSTGDLVTALYGGSARNVEKAFQTALEHLPCLLFFDEFDAIAQRRTETPDQEARRTVSQLLTSLEAYRDERRLLVVAATNAIEQLDPAVIRPGRFDRHIRIDVPDGEARRAIFRAELDERPCARDLDLDEVVRRTEGMTPAAIAQIVDSAALDVFREATQAHTKLDLETKDLVAAIERYGGQDRPTVEHWSWDSLILPEEIKAQLQQLQAVIENPDSAARFGVDPPTGLLLAGPPGTGKTTVAKVLAAQARVSFYPVSGADVLTKWVGDSEQNIRQLFERARENRPSIVFIDEVDAIAGRRGESLGVHDSHVNQLLAEMDGLAGQRGVFVIAATNRPDQLDPALLRGGRLSRTIVLGLPDEAGRLAMLRLHTARMPTVAVRLEELAAATDGFSPADLKSLAQEAALCAMARTGDQATPAVRHDDFVEALERLRSGRAGLALRAR